MKNFFDLVAPIYERIHFGAAASYRKIYALGNFEQTDRVLDLGGGSGRIAKFFVGQVREITVADSSPGMLAVCRKHGGINCVLAFAENLPFADGYFDKIIIVDAFHHFQDHEKVAIEVERLLRKSGKLIIEEFNPAKPIGWLASVFESLLNMKSVFYTPASLSAFWSRYGFDTKLSIAQKAIYYVVLEKKPISDISERRPLNERTRD